MRTGPLVAGAVGALAFLLTGIATSAGASGLARLSICGAALAGAAATDLTERRIPNRLVLPATVACAVLSVAAGAPLSGLLAGLALATLFLSLSLLRPEALGMGDVKLALLVIFGLDGSAARALLLGLALAAAAGLLLVLHSGRPAGQTALPLAPFLATGALLSLLT
jgi:leader peptidase (prepilin peptidase) / N-methyltransferase